MSKSSDMEKESDKIQHLFMKKILRKLGIESNFLNLIKSIYKNHTANIVLNGERLNTSLVRLGTR